MRMGTPPAAMGSPSPPRRDVEQRFRSFMASRRKALSLRSSASQENAAQLHDLQVQARAIEQQLQDCEAKVIIAEVRRRFGEQAAAAVVQASEAGRAKRSVGGAGDPSAFLPAAAQRSPPKALDMSGPRWESTKVGLAAAAGGTALLVLTSGIPVLAVGVGLALVGGGATAATAGTWRKHRRHAGGADVTAEDVQRWRDHVRTLEDRLHQSEQIALSAEAAAPLAALRSGPAPVTDAVKRAVARALPTGGASGALPAAKAGDSVGPSPVATGPSPSPRARPPVGCGPVPLPLAEAFAQVRSAVHSDAGDWKLRAMYGAARILEHVHGGGAAPLCAVKGVVQIDAPPRSVRNMVLELKEVRRQWDFTFEHGNSVDVITPNSDVAHIILSRPRQGAGALAGDRDLLVWRHWVELKAETTAADAEASSGYLIVSASTLHAGCPPVHGLVRGKCLCEAWYIRPIAFSVRSEVAHFVNLSFQGHLGTLSRLSSSVTETLHRPFLERLGALALYANAKHGCLAVPLPQDGHGADGDDAEEDAQGDGGGAAVRTFNESTGLADDIFCHPEGMPLLMNPAPNVGGVNGFSQPKAEMFKVRTKNYLSDRIKEPSAPAAFDIAAVYSFQTHRLVRHVAAEPDSPLHAWRAQGTVPPFVFVVNMMSVGSPGFQGVFVFGMNEEEWGIHQAARAKPGKPTSPSDCFHKLLAEFCKHDFSPEANKFRDERFKLLPAIVQGPMLLKNSSGNRPAILGNKLKQSYYAGEGYFEVDVDCTTSRAAASVVNMVKGYGKTVVVDLAFIIQGNSEEELPERILGIVRFSRVDILSLPHKDHSPTSRG